MGEPEPTLRTRQVAQALGVSVSTVKRWVDLGELVANRTVGKHRLIPLSEAFDFARRRGLPFGALEALVRPTGPALPGRASLVDDATRAALAQALQRGDALGARRVIAGAFDAGVGAARLGDALIAPVMAEVGHAWEAGALAVYQEHEASQIVTTALAALSVRLARAPRPGAPLALGATPEGDPYSIALALGELCARELGWDVRNLGVSLPLKSLASAMAEHRPALVFLCVNYLADTEAFVRDFGHVRESAAPGGVVVLLGGRALSPDLRARLAPARFGERIEDLAGIARGLNAPGRPL